MRVLFTVLPAAAHLYPMVPTAWALRAAGHEVRIAGAPQMQDPITHSGLPGVVVGRDPAPFSAPGNTMVNRIHEHHRFPADWPLHPHLLDADQRAMLEHLGRNAAKAAKPMLPDLIAFARDFGPDLIVHDTGGFAGAVVAALLGVPNVRHLTGVGLRPMEYRMPDGEPLPEYVALFQRYGAPLRAQPTLTIDPSPPSLRLPVREPWRELRFVAYNGAGPVPWPPPVRAGRPTVCVTWGFSAARSAPALGATAFAPFQDALDAAAGLDVDVLAVTTQTQAGMLDRIPAGVRLLPSAPLHLVLPGCAAVIHQCGDGTALTSAAAGIPQLAITRKPDPALTADRLAAAHAGIHLRYQELAGDPDRVRRIRAALEELVNEESYRSGARRLRAEIERQPSPAAVVLDLLALTEPGRRPSDREEEKVRP